MPRHPTKLIFIIIDSVILRARLLVGTSSQLNTGHAHTCSNSVAAGVLSYCFTMSCALVMMSTCKPFNVIPQIHQSHARLNLCSVSEVEFPEPPMRVHPRGGCPYRRCQGTQCSISQLPTHPHFQHTDIIDFTCVICSCLLEIVLSLIQRSKIRRC